MRRDGFCDFFHIIMFATGVIAAATSALHSPHTVGIMPTSMRSAPVMLAPVAWPMVAVEMDADAVADVVLYQVESAAEYAIRERGHFALAIPGGSVLKMLAKGKKAPEWASKTTVVYVNHKCVTMEDAALATHAKASALFLDKWGATPIVLDGSADAAAEAQGYEEKLKALPETVLPRNADGLVSLPHELARWRECSVLKARTRAATTHCQCLTRDSLSCTPSPAFLYSATLRFSLLAAGLRYDAYRRGRRWPRGITIPGARGGERLLRQVGAARGDEGPGQHHALTAGDDRR